MNASPTTAAPQNNTASSTRESFLATVEHRQPHHILYHSGFTPDIQRRVQEHIGTEDIAGHYGFMAVSRFAPRRPKDMPKIDYTPYFAGENLPEGTTFTGVGAARVPSGFYHFYGYVSPLRNANSLKEIEDYPLDDYNQYETDHLAAGVAAAKARGDVTIGHAGGIYEIAWQIRGYEEFLMDMIDRPAWAQCLLDRLCERMMICGRACAKAGVDMVQCGDDVANQNAMMFAKPMWQEFILNRQKSVWDEIKRINPSTRIWYHSDGNLFSVIGDLIDAGLDVLNPLQPEAVDVDAVHREFGHHLTLDGTIGTQTTMPFGTPAQVKARVKEVIDKYGRNGGLIVSPTHHLEPEVPLENIDALFEACREYGTFQ